jgi:transposase
MRLLRVFQFAKYRTLDIKEFLTKKLIEIHLERIPHEYLHCRKCGSAMAGGHGSYKVRIQHMPIFMNHCYLVLRRHKGWCPTCKAVRSESLDFISEESPHKSLEYSWWVGRLCEATPVHEVANIMKESSATTWRLDYKRMKRMLGKYKIPKVRRLCVDEVYARRKKRKGETRDDLFFTVICDLDTRRVIWVSFSRRKEALDEFFLIIGKKACEGIEVIASDQHQDYAASIKEHCPRATHVWDRFHIMQIFDEAVNETRKTLHEEASKGSEQKRLSRGKFRFMFLKKSSKRSQEEKDHFNRIVKENEQFLRLEIIKEAMHEFFNARNEDDAKTIFDNIGDWIWQAGFKPLMNWHDNLESQWKILKNYFKHRVTSALSEGMNNVIKTLKRSGYGYRNMHYFKLKILQRCGYLNSRYMENYQS